MYTNIENIITNVIEASRFGQVQKINNYIEELDTLYLNSQDPYIEGIKFFSQASLAYIRGSSEDILHYARLSLSIIEKITPLNVDLNKSLVIRTRNLIAVSLSNMGQREESLIQFQKNLAILENSTNYIEHSTCLNNIGYHFLLKGDYFKSINYFIQSLEIFNKLVSEYVLSNKPVPPHQRILEYHFKENIALAYIRQGEYAQAKSLLEEILIETNKLDDNPGKLKAIHDMGIIQSEQGLYIEARETLFLAIALANSIQNYRRRTLILGDFGELLLKSGELNEAKDILEKTNDLLKEINNEEELVRRLCQLAEVYDLLEKENEFVHYLNLASQLANKHGSDEEILITKFTMVSKYFRHGQIELASLFLHDIYLQAQNLHYAPIIIKSELFLSAIEISKFLEERKLLRLNNAKMYLQNIINVSKQQNLVLNEIHGLYLFAILSTCVLNVTDASEKLTEAKELAIKTENTLALERIMSLKRNIQYINTILVNESNTEYSEEIFLKHGINSFLRDFADWTRIQSKNNLLLSLGDLMITQEIHGPNIYYQSKNINEFANPRELTRSSYAITAVTGQGTQYFQGLFGPFPISTKSIAIVYACFIPDSKMNDHRYQGKNYCLYMLLFPFETKLGTITQSCLKLTLEKEFSIITDVRNLSGDWFINLKNIIIKNCFNITYE